MVLRLQAPSGFNDRGELLTFTLTPGNVDDRAPVPQFAKRLFGKLVGDKGYLSQPLLKQLQNEFGIELITPRRKNMKPRQLPLLDKLLLRKRAIVETLSISSRTSRRSSTPAIALQSTSWSICSAA